MHQGQSETRIVSRRKRGSYPQSTSSDRSLRSENGLKRHKPIEPNGTNRDLISLAIVVIRAKVTGMIILADQQLALQAVSDAQCILEEYLEPRPHNNERILDRLVDILARPELLVAVERLKRGSQADW